MAVKIQCSKPDCFWEGAPAEAAAHLCPTPKLEGEAPVVEDVPAQAAAGAPLFATKDELEHWLADHGVYTATGEPANAETVEADRQYALFLAAEKAADAPPPEPDIDDADVDEQIAAQIDAALADGKVEDQLEDAVGLEGLDGDLPWRTQVAAQIRARDDRRQLRWALVDEDAAELVDAHAIKSAADQAMVPFLDGGREISLHRVSDVLKQADALAEGQAAPGPAEVTEAFAADADETDAQLGAEGAGAEETPDEGALAGDLEDDETDASETTDEVAKPEEANVVPLFNAADYDKPGLQIPKVDGHAIDRIALNFGGGVMLDRSEPNDVTLYNRIHGQQTIELWVEAKWGGTGAKPATNRDGDLDVIVGHKSLRVESIRIVDPAALGQLEGLELVRAAVRRAVRAGVPDDQIETACVLALAENE